MSISSYASDSSAASNPHSYEFSLSLKPIPSVGHGSARHSGDVCDRARCRFVSSRFIQFMYNLRFDNTLGTALTCLKVLVLVDFRKKQNSAHAVVRTMGLSSYISYTCEKNEECG
eukprot:scaffold6068_cov119-Isochrysis_galbana.AAC.17